MSKKMTKKELVNRARAARRRQSLKVDSPVTGKKVTLEEANHDVIKKMEAAIKS